MAISSENVLVSRLKMPKVTISGTNYEPTLKAGKVTNATGYEFWHSLDGVTWTKEQKSTSNTFKMSYDPYEEHYYRVRAYRTEGSKTYASDFKIVYPYDFE